MKTQRGKYNFVANLHSSDSTTGEPVGGRQGPLPAKEGNNHGPQAGKHAVGAAGAEGEPGVR